MEGVKSVMTQISTEQQAYLRHLKKHRMIVQFFRFFLLLLFLGLWEISSGNGWIDSFIFSSPSRIFQCFLTMTKDRFIFPHIRITFQETMISFLLVTFFGILLAILLWSSQKCSEILDPYLVVLNSLPKSALAPLLIVWLGATKTTIIVAGMSVAIFGTILNLYTGFTETSREKIRLIYTLHGTKKDALTKVVLPSTVPMIISIMKVNIGLCLVGVVIGEFIGARNGLGYLIIYGSQVFQLELVILSILILCLMAMLLYGGVTAAEKLYHRRQHA